MNDWLLTRCNTEDEAKKIREELQKKYTNALFKVAKATWGAMSFFEIRIIFEERISADKFVDMGIFIGRLH